MFENLWERMELHEAAMERDADLVQRLLDEGADIDACDSLGTTPLMFACCAKKTDVSEDLKRVNAEFAPETGSKGIPLKDAAETMHRISDFDPMKLMTEMRRKQVFDDTPPQDDPAVASLLLKRGAAVNRADRAGQSPLMKAAISGQTETVRLLLEQGADLNARDIEDRTPLMLAAQARQLETVQLLLEAGADADARTPSGGTTLMAAAQGGRVAVAQLLLEKGQDVNTAGVHGITALILAAMRGHEEMIAFLKREGAKIGFLEAVVLGDLEMAQSLPVPTEAERTTQWGEAVMHWAVRGGHAERIRIFLARGIDLIPLGQRGRSFLSMAVMWRHLEIARLLLNAGADPNGIPGTNFSFLTRIGRQDDLEMKSLLSDVQCAPLAWAAKHGDLPMMNLLLECGANPDAAYSNRETALMSAVMSGKLEAARLLLEAGADPNASSKTEMSMLTFAIVRSDQEIVKLLIEHGAMLPENEKRRANIQALAQDKPEIAAMLRRLAGTELHELARRGENDALLMFLKGGANIDASGENGQTPLMAALRGRQPDTARVLIEQGASLNVVDHQGKTALICAAARDDRETARLLIERGAEIDLEDGYGRTALTHAALQNKPEMVALLIEAGATIGTLEAAILGDLTTLRDLLNAGAEVDARNAGGMTPLMGASAGGHLETMMALLTRRADPNAIDKEGKTPLTWAVACKRTEAVRLLLDNGAQVNLAGDNLYRARFAQQDRSDTRVTPSKQPSEIVSGGVARWDEEPASSRMRGATPLGCALLHQDTNLALLLLERGADIDAPSEGHTPLFMATLLGRTEIVDFLLQRGANPHLLNEAGVTVLKIARLQGRHPKLIALLEAAEKVRPPQP